MKSVFKKNPNWWGLTEKGYFDGNVEDDRLHAGEGAGTRMAALLANNLDFILDPPVQDVESQAGQAGQGLRRQREPHHLLRLRQNRDELLYSNVKGKNPFKDKRVRQAFYQAIDVNAINKTVMRGLSKPRPSTCPIPP